MTEVCPETLDCLELMDSLVCQVRRETEVCRVWMVHLVPPEAVVTSETRVPLVCLENVACLEIPALLDATVHLDLSVPRESQETWVSQEQRDPREHLDCLVYLE